MPAHPPGDQTSDTNTEHPMKLSTVGPPWPHSAQRALCTMAILAGGPSGQRRPPAAALCCRVQCGQSCLPWINQPPSTSIWRSCVHSSSLEIGGAGFYPAALQLSGSALRPPRQRGMVGSCSALAQCKGWLLGHWLMIVSIRPITKRPRPHKLELHTHHCRTARAAAAHHPLARRAQGSSILRRVTS